jgi:hypothetical protein
MRVRQVRPEETDVWLSLRLTLWPETAELRHRKDWFVPRHPPLWETARLYAHSEATKWTTASAAWSRFCSQVRPDCLRGLKL